MYVIHGQTKENVPGQSIAAGKISRARDRVEICRLDLIVFEQALWHNGIKQDSYSLIIYNLCCFRQHHELFAYKLQRMKQGGVETFLCITERWEYMKIKDTVHNATLLEEKDFNLSDFALFLSVMKYKEAYESTLSIIMDDPDLELKEVKVEEVILNRVGKRAIRLDAWALDTENRQYNTEMQNDASKDDVRKRARYYQGLLDTPVLKAGKKTRYRQLPSSFIIFITQEDIFGCDRAMYTFTEQCEEVEGLHLEDGTTKIFLNMTSKNGRDDLVSLLQYMKETRLNNPEILVQDCRIEKLAAIVDEVKQSEEWEAVKMSVLSIGLERGEAIGKEIGKEIGKKIGMLNAKREIILMFLDELGPVPEDLCNKIMEQSDLDMLNCWVKKAARSETIADFVKLTEDEAR